MIKIIINKYVTKLELNCCKKSFLFWSSDGLNSSIVSNKKKICNARLSSDHQKEKSQVGILDRFYPGTEIIKDIESGLNFRKKEFISLLVQVYSGEVKEIIVLYNDRL
jgi:predicted site-specific integrase-resolvase